MFTSLGRFQIELLGETVLVVHAPGSAPPLARYLEDKNLPGVLDIVPAFDQVALYFETDPDLEALDRLLAGFEPEASPPGRTLTIPVCYDMGEDLDQVCDMLGLRQSEFVDLHSRHAYDCKAIGFCPGFAYLGWLDPSLSQLGRKDAPSLKVPPGSVAIAGRMTGVYPLERPGGWWLVGRTPMTLVDVESGYFPIAVGDVVQFKPIARDAFDLLQGARL